MAGGNQFSRGDEPNVFTQQNRYLPFFTFRGYSQSMPLKYNTTIDPKILSSSLDKLDKTYETNQAGFETGRDTIYKGLETAIGDIPNRNQLLGQFDSSANSMIDKYRDTKGRIAYESPEFQRDARTLVRQFALNPEISNYKETMLGKQYYDTVNKDPDALDFNPYFNPEKGRYWDTKQDGVFRPDVTKRQDYIKPVTELWDKVKSDVKNKEIINLITGITTKDEFEKNRGKIDALVDDARDVFLQTNEGATMYRELTEAHMYKGQWVDPIPPEAALEKIRDHVASLSEFYKYDKSSIGRSYDLSAAEKEELKSGYATKKFKDANGNVIEESVMPAGTPLTYTRIGERKFDTELAVDEFVSESTKNIENVKKDAVSYFTSDKANLVINGKKVTRDAIKFVTDPVNGYPKLIIEGLTPDLINEHQHTIDKYNNDLQLQESARVYATKFKEQAKTYAGITNPTGVEQKKYKEMENQLFAHGVGREYKILQEGRDMDKEVFDIVKADPNGGEAVRKIMALKGVSRAEADRMYYAVSKAYDFTSIYKKPEFGEFDEEYKADIDKQFAEAKKAVFGDNSKWAKYFDFFTEHAKDTELPTYEFLFATDTKGEGYEKTIQKHVEPLITGGHLLVYRAVGDQNVPLTVDEVVSNYKGENGKEANFQITGWRYDEDNGLVMGATIGKERVEIRDYANLNSYITSQGHVAQFRLDQVKQINDGFNATFGQESTVGWKGVDQDGKEVDYTFKVERLLYDQGPHKEGQMIVDFGEGKKSFNNEAELLQEYMRVMSEKQQVRNQFRLITDGTTTIVKNSTDYAKDAGNPYGLLREVKGEWGAIKFNSIEEGFQAGRKDIIDKVTGNSPVMKSRYGANYAETATLKDVVDTFVTWAHSGNNPDKYLSDVAGWLGVSVNAKLSELKDRADDVAKYFLRKENEEYYKKLYDPRYAK